MWSKRSKTERLFRSLTFRLTLGLGLLGYLVVWGLAIVLYRSVQVGIEGQVNRDLQSTGRVLLHRLEEDRESPTKELLDVGSHMSIRVLDLQGGVVIASRGMDEIVPPGVFPAATPEGAFAALEKEEDRPFHLASYAYREGVLQVARDGRDEAYMLRRLRTTLWWLSALVPLGAGLAGHFLVRLGLRPLKDVAVTVGSVRPETLTTRLLDGALPTELVPLARAFNATMGRLQDAFRRLSELNGDLAHELRTPIHALRLDVEALLADNLRPDVHERMAGLMATLEHLSAIVEQMLLLAKIEDPAQLLRKEPLDAGALLESAIAPFESLSEEQGVRLRAEADPGIVVHGDRVMLRRALHNLVANALRVAPEGSVVVVRATRVQDGVLLGVEDAGPGLPPEVAAQIGRRFLRCDPSRSAKSGGTGLGLAIVRGIAQLHGGDLLVGRGPGTGAVIQIKVSGT